MEKILFEQVPDLFACVGNLFVEKKEELCEIVINFSYGNELPKKVGIFFPRD